MPTQPLSSDDNLIGITGGTDGTTIGNVDDSLKVNITGSSGITFPHVNRVDVASAARTTSGNSGTLDSNGLGTISFICEVTAASGTTPTMDVFLEVSDDNSNWSQFIQTKRFTTTGIQRFQRMALGAKYYRYSWTVSGTTPSFTFSITSTLKAFLPKRFSNKIQYSFDLTQATGTVSETFQSADCNTVSLVTNRITDGGSSAQYKVQVSNDDITYVAISGAISQGSNSQNASTYTGAYRFYQIILTANANPGSRVMDIFWAGNS